MQFSGMLWLIATAVQVVAASDALVADSSTATHLASTLKSELVVEEKVQKRLRRRLDAVSKVAHRDFRQLGRGLKIAEQRAKRSENKLKTELEQAANQLADARKSEISLQQRLSSSARELALEKKVLEEAKANASRANAGAETVAAQIAQSALLERKERLGLSAQISELNEKVPAAQKLEAAAEEKEKSAEKDADARVVSEEAEVKKVEAAAKSETASLKSDLQATNSNLTAAVNSSVQARQQTAALMQELKRQQNQLQQVISERTRLEISQNATARKAASLLQSETEAQSTLSETQKELVSTKEELADTKQRSSTADQEVSTLKNAEKSLQAQLSTVNASKAELAKRSQAQLHDTMLSAAKRIHELEDSEASMEKDLAAAKKQLATANADESKLQGDLQREEESAEDSSHQVDALKASSEKDAGDRKVAVAKAEDLSKQASELQLDRTKLAANAKEATEAATHWHAQAEDEEKSSHDAMGKAAVLEKQNDALKSQVSALSDEGQRADELAGQLAELRKQADSSAKQASGLQEQMQRIRDLKDQYSSQYEAARNQSNTYQAEATMFAQKLSVAVNVTRVLAAQRDSSVERVKEARSQEDEYFEENSHLQQQAETLTGKLRDTMEQVNNTEAEKSALLVQVDNLKTEATHEQSEYHATWVENQRDLMKAHSQTKSANAAKKTIQAELRRMRPLLDNKQRQLLGLPVLKEDPKTARLTLGSRQQQAQQGGSATMPSPPQLSRKVTTVTAPVELPVELPVVAAPVVAMPAVVPVATPAAAEVQPQPQPKAAARAPHHRGAASLLASGAPKGVVKAAAVAAHPKVPSSGSALQRLAEYFASAGG